MENDLAERKLYFLYKAIEDAQHSIRSIDTKISINTILFGIYVSAIGSGLTSFAKYFGNMPAALQVFFIACLTGFFVSVGLIIVITLNILIPNGTPSEHIGMQCKPKGIFYLSNMETNFWDSLLDKKIVISPSFEEIKKELSDMRDNGTIENELIYELLKVSYIREIKTRRMGYVRILILISLLISLCMILLHYVGLSVYMPQSIA